MSCGSSGGLNALLDSCLGPTPKREDSKKIYTRILLDLHAVSLIEDKKVKLAAVNRRLAVPYSVICEYSGNPLAASVAYDENDWAVSSSLQERYKLPSPAPSKPANISSTTSAKKFSFTTNKTIIKNISPEPDVIVIESSDNDTHPAIRSQIMTHQKTLNRFIVNASGKNVSSYHASNNDVKMDESDIVENTTSVVDKNNPFISAREQLVINSNTSGNRGKTSKFTQSGLKRSLPLTQQQSTNQPSKFRGGRRLPLLRSNHDDDHTMDDVENGSHTANTQPTRSGKKPILLGRRDQNNTNSNNNTQEQVDERLKNIDPKLVEMIENEIMEIANAVTWDDIAGLSNPKQIIREIVVWPMLRPDIFTGLRGPPKGILLFGPPGTGKTMFGKCIASEVAATFFSISASSLTSKWVGEGEKLVRALFAVARVKQPSVIFIDEIDSLLSQRTDGEFEASRRIKTEFLIQFDGAGTNSEDRILLIGATNRPQEIDEAARRRLSKRLYIPLPDDTARISIVRNLLIKQNHSLSEPDFEAICERTNGYSGSDMAHLCREAALGPIRSISDIRSVSLDQVRPINLEDFIKAITQVRASVSDKDLTLYEQWNRDFGCL